MNRKDENNYRNILKGTSIVGGVQLFQVGVNLIRGKFVAMFLGPVGMGINSLFNSSSQIIQQLAGLGLNLAIVKEVADRKDDPSSLRAAISVATTLMLICGLVGALVCVMFAAPLSRLTFGDDTYYWQFMLLGVMVFFGVCSQGLYCVLQGMHQLKVMSRTTIAGSLAGLVIGVPLYGFFGTDGIVPAMIAMTFTMFIMNIIGMRKVLPGYRGRFAWQSQKPLIRKLVGMGIVLMATDALISGTNYLINVFIRYQGHLENVGLYQAANSLSNQYSGLVFSAMLIDFFPRLSAAAKDNAKVTEIVNRQLEIVCLIAAPLLSLLIMTSPLVITILLTDEFMPITELMRWLGMAVLLKAIMFPLGYITFAKDNKRVFFWLEGVYCNIQTLVLCCLGYSMFGLLGLSYGLIVDCTLCFFIYYFLNRHLYSYHLNGEAVKEIIWAMGGASVCFACSFITDLIFSYIAMGTVVALISVRSLTILKRRLRQ